MTKYNRYTWPPKEPTQQGEIWNGKKWVKATPEQLEKLKEKNEEH